MTTLTLNTNFPRTYANNGQHAEQVVRFTLTGEICKADNLEHTLGGDVLDIQIKSARATICKGTDVDAYLALDGANRFAYVTKDFGTAYIMSRAEWAEFCKTFGQVAHESTKNGGAVKLRLPDEPKAVREWLAARA